MGVADLDKLSPQIDKEFFFGEIGKVFPAVGEQRGKVAFRCRMHQQCRVLPSEPRHRERAHAERD